MLGKVVALFLALIMPTSSICVTAPKAVVIVEEALASPEISIKSYKILPNLEFMGSRVLCRVKIVGGRTSDKITANMKLWQGNKLIGNWTESGVGSLVMEKTAVASKKTYKLIVDYKINGIAQAPVSTTKTNR